MEEEPVTFERHPSSYRHWRLHVEAPVATLELAVDPAGGVRPGYELKLNSYDLGVDIELNDAVQRLRLEHPEVRVVVLSGGLDKVFCAGANIQMLAAASHAHKVAFCKLTNETRNAIEEASARSGQRWLAAVNGTAAGGGYELALACDEIVLVDDRSSAVSLPEVALLAVLPGTGGLTRVVDKRHVRRDLADVFSTRAEGVKGKQALEWGLVDHLAPPTSFDDAVRERAVALAATSDRPLDGGGVSFPVLDVAVEDGGRSYEHVEVRTDRSLGTATITVHGPSAPGPQAPDELTGRSWVLAAARQLDDAILHLRFNEPELGTWVLRTEGDPAAVLEDEAVLARHPGHWLTREIRLLWGRTLKRLDVSSRSLVALIEPGSCFAGTLAELALAADRSYLLDGGRAGDEPAALELSEANDGWYPMVHGISRLEARFWGRPPELAAARGRVGKPLLAGAALAAGLVTFTPDELDWDDEVRLALEERNGFSPDALTGMEANLRFPGPETMESKIFARLTAWQNWIFQRPNAVGPDGALHRFGTGTRPIYDRTRV